MKHKILYCAVEKLADILDSDEVVGWRVLAILPGSYVQQPTPEQLHPERLPDNSGWEHYDCPLPPIFNLTHVTIIMEA